MSKKGHSGARAAWTLRVRSRQAAPILPSQEPQAVAREGSPPHPLPALGPLVSTWPEGHGWTRQLLESPAGHCRSERLLVPKHPGSLYSETNTPLFLFPSLEEQFPL